MENRLNQQDEALQFARLLMPEGADFIIELRALHVPQPHGEPRNVAGWFDNAHDLARAALALDRQGAGGVYAVVNPLTDEAVTRLSGGEVNVCRLVSTGEAAKNQDVAVRRWLLVDVDPKRDKINGVKPSSTNEELRAARDTIEQIRVYLEGQGFPSPVIAMSGNGMHLMYRVDLPAESALPRTITHALAKMYTGDAVELDTSVHKRAQLWKFYGTRARKGTHTAERPHRLARTLSLPDALQVVPIDVLEKAQGKASPRKESHTSTSNAETRTRPTSGSKGKAERVDWDVPTTRELLQRVARRYPRPDYNDWMLAIAGTVNAVGASDAERLLMDVWPEEEEGEYSAKINQKSPLSGAVGKEILVSLAGGYDAVKDVLPHTMKKEMRAHEAPAFADYFAFEPPPMPDYLNEIPLPAISEAQEAEQPPVARPTSNAAQQHPLSKEEEKERQIQRLLAEFRTTEELALHPAPPTDWYAPRVLPKGALMMVAGPPKGGGKTTFVLSALSQVLKEGEFVGRRCTHTPVVYLTEQSRETFENEYLRKFGLMGRKDLHVLYGYTRKDATWDELIEAHVRQCLRTGAGILVIDTLAKFAQFKDENDAAEMQRVISPLQDACAEHGITIVCIHHTRKSGGEAFDAGRGSGAFAAAMDVLMTLQPLDEGVRPVKTIGRYADLLPDECRLKMEGGTFRFIGESKSSVYDARRDDVLDFLESSRRWFTVKDVKEAFQVDYNTAKKYLDELIPDGHVLHTKQAHGKNKRKVSHYMAKIHVDGGQQAEILQAEQHANGVVTYRTEEAPQDAQEAPQEAHAQDAAQQQGEQPEEDARLQDAVEV